jgi:hypothetical protein
MRSGAASELSRPGRKTATSGMTTTSNREAARVRSPRTARAREWCATSLGTNCLLVLAEDVLSIGGAGWLVVRGAVAAVFTGALVAWIVFAYRDRQRGAVRSWGVPVLMAAGVVAALLLLATLIN